MFDVLCLGVHVYMLFVVLILQVSQALQKLGVELNVSCSCRCVCVCVLVCVRSSHRTVDVMLTGRTTAVIPPSRRLPGHGFHRRHGPGVDVRTVIHGPEPAS